MSAHVVTTHRTRPDRADEIGAMLITPISIEYFDDIVSIHRSNAPSTKGLL
jgi:hypothetical protein